MASAEDDSFDFMSLAKASAEVGMKLYKEVRFKIYINSKKSVHI